VAKPRPVVQPLVVGPTAEDLCSDGVLTAAQFARFVGLELETCRKLFRRREVEWFRVRRRVVVARRVAVAWLAAQMRRQWEGGP